MKNNAILHIERWPVTVYFVDIEEPNIMNIERNYIRERVNEEECSRGKEEEEEKEKKKEKKLTYMYNAISEKKFVQV